MDGAGTTLGTSRFKALLNGGVAGRMRGLARNKLALYAAGPALLVIIGLIYFALTAGSVSTDDATVSAARVAVAPSVRGRIVAVNVHDNQFVHADDVLVQLEPTDYQSSVADAQARLASARLQVAALRTQYAEASAQASAARVTQSYAQRELTRQRNLFRAGVVSRRDVDNAAQAADVARQQGSAAAQAQMTALANLGGSARTPIEQHPLVMQAQAALAQAQNNLGNTVLRAARDGVVTRVDQIQIGSYAQPAQTLFWLISGQPWIDAAFKENQLEDLRPGQPAKIHIDAFPHQTFHGHVESLSPGTGSTFSVLPSQNGSGNWVKVVQRLNVRIALDDAPRDIALAVGLSATARVDTRHQDAPAQAALRGREQ